VAPAPGLEEEERAERLAELLRDRQKVAPRPEFQAALRQRLVSSGPLAGGSGRGLLAPAVLGLALVVGVAVVVVLVRGRGPATGPLPPPTVAPLALPSLPTPAAVSSAVDQARSQGPTAPTPTAEWTATVVEPSLTATAVTGPLPATPPATVAPAAPGPTSSGARSRQSQATATSEEDAPEQTPVPITTWQPSATAPAVTPTESTGGLPSSPSPAPTGQGWPTLPPPETAEP
jgi:hypothetical protein